MRLRKIFNRVVLLFLFFWVFLFSIASGSQMRSSLRESSDASFWVAVDFDVSSGQHVMAPLGKGKSMAPALDWNNVKILQTVWPTPVSLPPDDEYKGYANSFSVLFLISQLDSKLDVTCDVFYVVCDNACRPIRKSLCLQHDGKLTRQEIEKITKIPQPSSGLWKFITVLGMAFIGGIILNCMPCVFPVLSMKVFKILKNKTDNNTLIKKQGIAFGAGVISFFLSIGLFLFYMKQVGSSIGWGFYMQNTTFVIFLLLIFLFCALYFFNIVSIPNFNMVSKKQHGVYVQSFLNGVFTSVVSGVCVGPFVGVAIGTALMYNNILMVSSIFISLGFGVAMPFMSICLIPHLGKILPKQGKWMENLKEFMGFTMLFSCLWILRILASQVSISRLLGIITSLISLSMFLWILNKSRTYKIWRILSIIGIITSIVFSAFESNPSNKLIKWDNFSFKKLEELKRLNKPVFVNVTASWCMTCGLNDIVFDNKTVIDAFQKHDVQAIQADWTSQNSDITKFLSMYGSNAVPFNILYKPGSDIPVIMPTILSAENLIEELEK